jgi:hypothetical protein
MSKWRIFICRISLRRKLEGAPIVGICAAVEGATGVERQLQAAFRSPFAWSEQHLEEITQLIFVIKSYAGDKAALLASAR